MIEPTVRVSEGELVGIASKTSNGVEYFSFKGIPYAEPPVGERRFKAPVPKAKWMDVKDATKEGSVCPQINFDDGAFKGSEDCLFLNVSTLALPDSSAKGLPSPVMVYFHGGGFFVGSGNSEEFGPDHLLEKGVVFVSVNYRLGPLGFLCLDIPEVPGNAGLKDQSLALKWVKQNIHCFNGDPNNITIFGVSAGSASVEYHLLSPMSKDVFHKAIMQSGSVLNPWALTKDHARHTRELAEDLGINCEDPNELLDELQKANIERLVTLGGSLMRGTSIREELFGFVPVIEKAFPNVQAFLTSDPRDLMKNGDMMNVPTITGFCENEGSIFKLLNARQMEKLKEGNFADCFPLLSNKDKNEINESFAAVYDPTTMAKDLKPIDDFFSDLTFLFGIYRAIESRLMLDNKNYAYIFRFTGDIKFNIKMFEGLKQEGATHGTDIPYLANSNFFTFNVPVEEMSREYMMRDRMVQMWTDFAKHGNPTPMLSSTGIDWEQVDNDNFNFLEINDKFSMVPYPWKKRIQLWERFFD